MPESIQQKIITMIEDGYSPKQIIASNPRYNRYRTHIKQLFTHKRMKEGLKEMHNEWHICSFDISESLYTKWCNKFGKDSAYLCWDSRNHSFDRYGAQSTIFMKNFKGNIGYNNLLSMLDNYKSQLNFEYTDTYTLWDTCILTSSLPPEIVCCDIYGETITPLLRRLDTITYHYEEAGIANSFTMSAKDYRCLADLRCCAKHYKA